MGKFSKINSIRNNKNLFVKLLSFVPLILFLLFWEFSVKGNSTLTFLFASPTLVWNALKDGFASGELISDIGVTSLETILGFILGNICGSFLGLVLWYSETAAKILRPYIIAIGSVPIFAIAPMMIIWFGTGLFAKIMMAAISTVVVAIVQAYEGARNIDNEQINLLKSFGANKRKIFFKLIIPSSLIWVLSSYKINIGFALLGAFIGEFVSSEEGLGHRILKAGGLYDVPMVLAAVLCIILLALCLNGILWLIERKMLSWKYQ